MNLDDKYIKPLLRRAKCYLDLQQYDEAVRDYEKAYKLERTDGEYIVSMRKCWKRENVTVLKEIVNQLFNVATLDE